MNKYLYIDDNTEQDANGLIKGLSKYIDIFFRNPVGTWEDERNYFLDKDFKEFHGLILDLNLEEKKNPTTNKISYYKGSTLAQELRNLSKSKEMKEIPIVLLSANKNIDKYFDQTNKDLFDLIIEKESLTNSDKFNEISLKLDVIANAYTQLSEDKEIEKILDSKLENEDIKFLSEVNYQLLNKPSHSISNFFIKEILEKNGILINEILLFARLGIDSKKSDQEDLLKLKNEILKKIKYTGIFSKGWDRYWMSKLYMFWETISEEKTLRSLTSEERVQILNEKYGLKLLPFQKDTKSKSSKFWTACKGSNTFIDNIDGLLITGQEKIYPWQDKEYVCIEEALKPTNKAIWRDVSEIEKTKLELLKKKYPNERPSR